MESAYSTGNGVGKPRGIMTDAVLGKTTASATAITGDEIIDLAHSVDPAYRRSGRCAFVMNDAILAAIRKVKGSDGQYVWVPGLQNGTAGMLYGFKVAVNQGFDSTVAPSKKTILFGDISKYKIRDVRNLTLQVLRERYAEYNQVGVLVIARTDGRLLDAGTHPVKYLQQNA
jgi:HK97 family phage major capsid protein